MLAVEAVVLCLTLELVEQAVEVKADNLELQEQMDLAAVEAAEHTMVIMECQQVMVL
jgi:hypothetical protein